MTAGGEYSGRLVAQQRQRRKRRRSTDSFSLGSGRKRASMRGEKGASGLLGSPASYLNPTKCRGEGIRCTRSPTNPVYYGR